MSASTWSTESGSMPSHPQRAPTADPAPETNYDTALPPIQSKDMSVARRRPARPDSAAIIGNFRGMQRPGAPFPTPHDSMSNMFARGPTAHRRNESTLKTVMRKVFHRKRRSQTDEDHIVKPYHSPTRNPRTRQSENKDRETPAVLPKSLESKGNTPLQKEIRPTLMGLDKLDPIPSHHRRATIPSVIFPDDGFRHPLDKGAHGDNADLDSGVGRSLDDLRTRHTLCSKRRSRSTNSLRRKANEHRMSPIQWTRRSTEVTYLGSPAFGAVSDSELSARPPTRGTITSMAKPSAAPSVAPSVAESEHTQMESIAPSVGNLVHAMQHDDSLTPEQRLTTLEVKLIDLEFAISRMQDKQSSTQTSPTGKTRSKKSSTPPDTARLRVGQQASGHSSPFAPTIGSSSNSPRSPEARPASTSTLRPNALHRSRTYQPPSSPNLDGGTGVCVEQYNALLTLLQDEQSAQRNLEDQMSSLREDMQQLQKTARDSLSLASMYPLPSTESHEARGFRPALDPAQTKYPVRPEKPLPLSKCDGNTGLQRSGLDSKNEVCLRQLERRIEIAGMI